ncbi:MAG: hypothetical protein K1X44_08135 [Alphaproteobacteria bacterium]|nr:hypothetical protein [Alphaproteobacteria bacterium]
MIHTLLITIALLNSICAFANTTTDKTTTKNSNQIQLAPNSNEIRFTPGGCDLASIANCL